MNNYKTGQVTIFFIFGLLLVVIGVFVFFIINASQTKKADTEFIKAVTSLNDVNDVKNYVDFCLDSSLKSGLLLIGRQGGYAVTPADSNIIFNIVHNDSLYVSGFNFEVYPNYNNRTQILVPSKEVVSSELEIAILNLVDSCITELNNTSKNLDISVGSPSVSIEFLDRTTVAKMNLSINLSEKDKVVSLDSFNAIIPFYYSETFRVTQVFTEKQVDNLDYFDLGYLSYLSDKDNFKFERSLLDGDKSLIKLNFGEMDDLFSDDFVINFAIFHTSVQEALD